MAIARRLAWRVGRTIRPSRGRVRARVPSPLTNYIRSDAPNYRAGGGTKLLSLARRQYDRAHHWLGCRHRDGILDSLGDSEVRGRGRLTCREAFTAPA